MALVEMGECVRSRGGLFLVQQGKERMGCTPPASPSHPPPCGKGYLWCQSHPGGDSGKLQGEQSRVWDKQEEMPTTAKDVILQHHPNCGCGASRWRDQALPGLFTPVSRALGRGQP